MTRESHKKGSDILSRIETLNIENQRISNARKSLSTSDSDATEMRSGNYNGFIIVDNDVMWSLYTAQEVNNNKKIADLEAEFSAL